MIGHRKTGFSLENGWGTRGTGLVEMWGILTIIDNKPSQKRDSYTDDFIFNANYTDVCIAMESFALKQRGQLLAIN